MKSPVLLTYNISGERGRKIRTIAARYKVRVRQVSHEELGCPIGHLASQEDQPYTPYEGEGFAEEMMIMAHFPSAIISRFLDAFRHGGVPSVRLKAMMTETNSQWDSAHLHGELQQESAYFGKLRKMAHDKKQAEEQAEDAPQP